MIRFAELRREELQPADYAAMSRWRSFAAVNMFSWGVATSAVAYIGARLAAPRGPLPTASKVITAAAFIVGGASALPATAPQLIHEAQTLPTPFGQYVRESFQKQSTAAGLAGSRRVDDGQVVRPSSWAEQGKSADKQQMVNQWGDPVVTDSAPTVDSDTLEEFSEGAGHVSLSTASPWSDEARD